MLVSKVVFLLLYTKRGMKYVFDSLKLQIYT